MNTTKALPESETTDLPRPSQHASSPSPSGASGNRTRTPWPTGAKALTAFLAIAVIAAVIVAIAVAADGRSTDDDPALLTQEQDEAIADTAELDAELASVQATNAELTDRIGEVEATATELQAQTEGLEADLAAAAEQVAALTAERDALAEQFPMQLDTSLAGVDLVGDHELDLTEVLCQGLPSCGMLPAIDEITVGRTAEGWLQLSIPGYAEGGLLRADGALQMVVSSATALPACDGVERSAKVAMTLLPGTYEIAADGTVEVTTVGAVLTIDAPAIGDCPAALAYYSGVLSPVA